MKKFLVVLLVAVMLLPVVVKAEGLELGVDKFKTAVFWDFDKTYSGGLLPALNYKDLVSLDFGFLINSADVLGSVGLSVNLATFAKAVKINYTLPGPIEIGTFYARKIEGGDYNKFGLYFGLKWKLDK